MGPMNLLSIKAAYLEKESLLPDVPHELTPKSEYAGQKRKKPVAEGINPSHPHQPTVPFAASATKISPTEILKIRSMPPTLHFILNSL
jgi:hypothetical protein